MSITSYPALTRIATDGNAVSFAGPTVDAFGKLRVSQPFTLFDSQNRYDKNSLFDEATSTGGSVSYLVNESSVQLNTTTASGSEVVRQSYKVFPYQPGKSLLIMNTFVMGPAQANMRCRIGYFSTQNGAYLERNGSAVRMVKRSYVTGSVVEAVVEQANWNGDKLDGTGASGITLDLTKGQIFWMDLEWLGVGSVRCGFVIDGVFIVAHTFHHANNISSVYFTTATLPIRYEITNTDATASAGWLKQICSTVISEGGYEKRVALKTASMTTQKSVGTTFVPLVSIRLDSARPDAVIIPDGYAVLPTASTATVFEIALYKNATLTGASWVQSSSNNVEYDITATALSGGTLIENDFVESANKASGRLQGNGVYNFDMQLGRTIAGTSDVYTIAVRTLSGTQNAIGSMSFWDLL